MKASSAATATKLQPARYSRLQPSCRRAVLSTASARAAAEAKPKTPLNDAARQKSVDRDLFLDVLSATASKREAKSYLSNFKPPPRATERSLPASTPYDADSWGSEVNLGSLYLPVRSIDQSPRFSQVPQPQNFADPSAEPLRTALVLMRVGDKSLDDRTLESVGRTLSQLRRLGLSPIIVVDGRDGSVGDSSDPAVLASERLQASRVATSIESSKGQRASLVDSAYDVYSHDGNIPAAIKIRGNVRVSNASRILSPLLRGTIPVVIPLGFNHSTHAISLLTSEDAILALTREFAGFTQKERDRSRDDERPIRLDRLIIIDTSGGIPEDESKGWHVFVNLEQEYDSIRSQLSSSVLPKNLQTKHLSNLQLARDVLSILPPTSSALITTPAAAASAPMRSTEDPGVGTRSTRNPLIHNLLTDKPIFSSSLPQSRQSNMKGTTTSVSPVYHQQQQLISNPPTFLKRGMPVTIFPDPMRTGGSWAPPSTYNPPFPISSAELDLPRLIHLIEDSFRRPLDARAYFERIAPRLAGIIVAGAYEGCAILTWETSPAMDTAIANNTITGEGKHGANSTGVTPPRSRAVPYLDKFAVLQRSQGSGGVADILFNAMVRDCFPAGVVWRSRSDNPVNRWYFERARGSWRIPTSKKGEQSWTMFWTTEGVEGQRFTDYEDVCRSIGTSWADGQSKLD